MPDSAAILMPQLVEAIELLLEALDNSDRASENADRRRVEALLSNWYASHPKPTAAQERNARRWREKGG